MKALPAIPLISSLLWCAGCIGFAHPSSGIVVNAPGEIYFVHSGRGVAKFSPDGKLTYIHATDGAVGTPLPTVR